MPQKKKRKWIGLSFIPLVVDKKWDSWRTRVDYLIANWSSGYVGV